MLPAKPDAANTNAHPTAADGAAWPSAASWETSRQAADRRAARRDAAESASRDAVARYKARRVIPQHLYLVEMVGHCVKVGITTQPKSRIATHCGDARKFGYAVGRIWVSYAHPEARLNEMLLQVGCRSRTEYLERRFERLIARALKLTMTRVEVPRG